ncbi:hypothetical protein EDC94DRAFT_645664 [Helicostylum pulchrum]|nr:hypothetical protein EDC94DRAFT_645664 [Helicostylum pulchrum]
MDKETELNLSQEMALIQDMGPVFVELIISQGYWRFSTILIMWTIAQISRILLFRTSQRNSFKEKPALERLLSSSGLIGSTNSSYLTAFVGSALQTLPSTISTGIQIPLTEEILITKAKKKLSTSSLLWQFNSSRFSENNFKPLATYQVRKREDCGFGR